MEKRFLIPLACGIALSLLILSGLSCVSCVIHYGSSAPHALPMTESEFEPYIMPECPSVKETLQDIFAGSIYELTQAGFDDIRDWVAASIAYKSDQQQWGGDYWQTPEETLSYRTGDCEDFAILLCSILRAYGIDAEQMYVVLGVNDEEYRHAFLNENWYLDGEWRSIESQAYTHLSSWYSWFWRPTAHPDSELDEYEITVAFNDIYYHDESFPWD